MSEPSWSELQQRGTVEKKPTDEFERLAAQTFSTGPGARFLDLLRHRHFNTGGNPLADEANLRVRAAYQQLILDIERARERGMEALKR